MSQRTSDVRDAMAEMAERAQLISQEAGTKIVAAMKDVIGSAAGVAGFAVESARDLVQFMVRRGQMSQEEADRLIREAEDAQGRRSRSSSKSSAERSTSKAESAREAARREPTKGVAASVKQAAAPAPAMKVERAEKAPKTDKKAKQPAVAKKSSSKAAPAKKRR